MKDFNEYNLSFVEKTALNEYLRRKLKNEKVIGWGDDFYQWFQRREKKIDHQ